MSAPLTVAAPTAEKKGLTGMAFVIKKLFTKEDPQMLHKVLGLLSLVSFFYRYGYVYNKKGNLGFNGSALDWATMALHIALSTSSLIFHVLQRRILKKPYIIWEEYRLHAISFSLRCAAVFIMGYLEANRFLMFPAVMVWHLIADEISKQYGQEGQTTVRGTGRLPWRIKLLTKFYGFYQFCAIASHLLPNPRVMDMGFNTLIAIQSSAFLMTLFRKGLIPYAVHGIGYTLCLVMSLYHIALAHTSQWFFPGVGLIFALRVNFGTNKYVLWTMFALVAALPDIIKMAELQGEADQAHQFALDQHRFALNSIPAIRQEWAIPDSGWEQFDHGVGYVAAVADKSMGLLNESGLPAVAAEYLGRSVGQTWPGPASV